MANAADLTNQGGALSEITVAKVNDVAVDRGNAHFVFLEIRTEGGKDETKIVAIWSGNRNSATRARRNRR